MQQPTLGEVTPEVVLRAAAVAVGTTVDELIGDDLRRPGRRPADQHALARHLAAYSLNRQHGVSLHRLAQILHRDRTSVRLGVRRIAAAVEDGNATIAQYLAVMGQLVQVWAASEDVRPDVSAA